MMPPRVVIRRKPALVLISLGLISPLLLSACTQKITSPKGPGTTICLDARSDWQGTGLRVAKGQKLCIECFGRRAVAPENESRRWPDTGPEGHGNHPGEKVHAKGDPKKEQKRIGEANRGRSYETALFQS